MAEPNFSDVFEEDTLDTGSLSEEKDSDGEEEQTDESAASSRRETEKDAPDRDEELSAARREERISAEKEMDELFRDVGMVNPYTNEVIRSKADFLLWKKRFQEDSASAAREDHASAEERNAENTVGRTVERELAKIRRWDDEVTSLEDIADSPNFAAVYEKVMRGYDLSDAVYLANAEKYRQRAASRAEQAAINRLRSKEHLVGVRARGGGETVVPRDVMAEFKRLMPKASGEEIRKFYRKDQAHLKK